MPDPQVMLADAVSTALVRAFGSEGIGVDPLLRPATNPTFGDYQANAAMSLARKIGRTPRDVAEGIVAHLELGGRVATVEVAGPGFINFTLERDWIAGQVDAIVSDERLGVVSAASPETVVVDYSSPNVAREMHVGHLRTTVIGDALVRLLVFLGHRVIRQNHLGDWGTQFGMLIEELVDEGWQPEGDHEIGDLNELYQAAQRRFESDAGFAERARQRVVALQSGDPTTVKLWHELVAESERHFRAVFERLGVLLTDEDIRGESSYNDELAQVVAELEAQGLTVVDDGALCVYPPGFTGREGDPLPLIVRKSDGGYLYAATDLAALRYRTRVLGARRVIYVVDARQAQHFALVFAVARMAGWLAEAERAEHVPFGTVLGSDGRPFRTRSGTTVRLVALLDEAVQRASAILEEKDPDLSPEVRGEVARSIGIGALKYADLSNDRTRDYVFDWDRMLSFDGNTAAYLQNAYVRARSILRRSGEAAASASVVLEMPQERALGLCLLRFDSAVHAAAEALAPHRLCGYLFELGQTFTDFYEHCPVLRSESETVRRSRLVLCALTARVLRLGLGLLGIEVVEQM